MYQALITFGAPLSGVSATDFATEGVVYQIGKPPIRVDILTAIQGVNLAEAWDRRVSAVLSDTPVNLIARADLIANKRAVGRPQDLIDAEALSKPPFGS